VKFARVLLGSLLLHGVLFGLALGVVSWQRAHAEDSLDIDVAGSSLLMRPKNDGARPRPAAPPQPWLMALQGRYAPPPKAEPLSATAAVPESGPPCPAPCPENAGDWMPASAASRRPAWSEGMISEDDYPDALRSKGVEGRVVAEVLIDAAGVVRGASIVQGSEPEFNALVLERLKQAKFRPAYDADGNAKACRLRLPVGFKLHN
jgi:TonB family protein